jgi:hypothetical protein
MPAITLHDFRPLLDQFEGEGKVLSCYADLGIDKGSHPNWRTPFQTKSEAIRRMTGTDNAARRELETDLAAVRRALAVPPTNGARWRAVFSSDQRGFFRVIPLDVPVETEVVYDRSPYLVPLLEAAHRRREYLAIQTDTHQGRIFAATPGEARVLAELDAPVPRKMRSSGDRWGYVAPTIASHRDEQIAHYRKQLVSEIEHIWDAERYAGVVLLGEHEVLERLRDALPRRIATRVMREAPESWYEGSARVENRICSLVHDVEVEAETPPGFDDLLQHGTAIISGPRAVLDAVQGGRIQPEGHGYLVFGPDPHISVDRCVVCRWLSLDGEETCTRCHAPCVSVNLWEELLLLTYRHRFLSRFLKDREKLAPFGGLVAVLPRPKNASR